MNTPASPAGTKTPSCVVTKKERIRRALSELLPSQKDADLIFAGSGAWLLVHTLTFESDSNIVKSIFDLESIREGSAVKISRTLLYFAVMLQQLDSDFDARQLQMYPAVDARMERYISTVQSLVASDDELMASMAGLECLVLIGLYQMNAGNPRRSWLVFRRCMNIGQLLGIDRKGASNIPTGKEVWYQIVQIERYLVSLPTLYSRPPAYYHQCLLLGLPAGCADPELDVEDSLDNPAMTKDTFFRWKVCNISSRIIERNQASASMLAYASTQNIDEQLDSLAKEVGPDWWAIPNVIPNNRSKESAAAFDRLMSQIWFFQLESLLHLPFMLRASTERRFEYSKFSCFKASREVMYRYLLLRSSDNKAFCCNVVDFGALTSAVTLFLGLLEADNGDAQEKQREADRALIQMVLAAMEELATDRKDVVAMQSVNVIKALLAFNSSSTSLGLAPGANFKLTIPYFGTITIARSQTSTPQQSNGNTPTYFTNGTQQQQQRQPLSINHQLPSGNWPGFTFTPSFPVQNAANGTTAYDVAGAGLYGPLEGVSGMGDWGLGTADTMFFDSLLSTDIEGNWVL